jgi:predicted O-methyltransferase YrrM
MKRFINNPEKHASPGSPVLRDLIYGWDNELWSGLEAFLCACIQDVLNAEGPVLECGSGLSTLLIGTVAQKRHLRIWSLEGSKEWGEKVTQNMHRFKLDSVELCVAPIISYGEYDWYDAPFERFPEKFSLIICDGPPSTTKGGRNGLVEVLKTRIAPGSVLLLDDAHRSEETAMARHWASDYNASLSIYGDKKPYFRLVIKAPEGKR